MCGMCIVITKKCENDCTCVKFVERRGPDFHKKCSIKTSSQISVHFSGHILHLRGVPTPQPLTSGTGDLLLWNGEIFDGIQVDVGENDTKILLETLQRCSSAKDIVNVFSTIDGPWAFSYWQKSEELMWFGRDIFGRRSLLWHFPDSDNDSVVISSVRIPNLMSSEIPAIGIYCLKISNCDEEEKKMGKEDLHLDIYPWENIYLPTTMEKVTDISGEIQEKVFSFVSKEDLSVSVHCDIEIPRSIPQLSDSDNITDLSALTDAGNITDLSALTESENNIDYLKKLLSTDDYLKLAMNQLKEVLLKAVATRVWKQEKYENVSIPESEGTKIPHMEDTARIPHMEDTARIPHMEDTATNPNENSEEMKLCEDSIRGIHINTEQGLGTEYSESDNPDVRGCSDNPDVRGSSDISGVMSASMPYSCDNNTVVQTSSKVAILFSGGIDSTVIAALADEIVPKDEEIDLLNVAFEQTRKINPNAKHKHHTQTVDGWDPFGVPDRLTGRTALTELNSQRKWNFIEINIGLEELQKARNEHVRHLVYPLNTVLDDSIGCAVWFASRGIGTMRNSSNPKQIFQSSAKVILCGMGADEQLAGYARHRARFKEEGWAGLRDEIHLEINRISSRNLGRDDRIISDHGREARFPYLDENVVKFLSSLPLSTKANLNLPRGIGEKLLLRLLATELKLYQTATLPKRAIQFGSRIAKMENNKEKASDVCQRLKEN